MIESLLFIFGTVIGSFLNVCIHRIPRKMSVVSPRSFCPNCNAHIPLYHNIPVFSYLWLRGKCFNCQSGISIGYPIVEILTGILTVFTYAQFGFSPEFIFYAVFVYFLIVISFIDLATKLILNKLLILLLLTGVLMNLLFKVISWNEALIGFLCGGALMVLIALLGKLIFHKESLGMGDIKFAAVAGFFLGWKMILIATFLGFIISLPVLLTMMLLGKIRLGDYVPLGPFLAVAMITLIYWGNEILIWYWHLFVSKAM